MSRSSNKRTPGPGIDTAIEDPALLEAARVIRPYLTRLVGRAADDLDHEIAVLLASAASGQNVAPQLRSLLHRDERTADFLTEVLRDAPTYRPPDMQPGHKRWRDRTRLDGDVAPVLHSGKFECQKGDYVWYRPAVGDQIPACPTHGTRLIRT